MGLRSCFFCCGVLVFLPCSGLFGADGNSWKKQSWRNYDKSRHQPNIGLPRSNPNLLIESLWRHLLFTCLTRPLTTHLLLPILRTIHVCSFLPAPPLHRNQGSNCISTQSLISTVFSDGCMDEEVANLVASSAGSRAAAAASSAATTRCGEQS